MSAIHLALRGDIMCSTPQSWHTKSTPVLNDVTCRRCERNLTGTAAYMKSAIWERDYEAASLAACEASGIGHLWHAVDASTPSGRIVRNMIAAVGRYFAEARILASFEDEAA